MKKFEALLALLFFVVSSTGQTIKTYDSSAVGKVWKGGKPTRAVKKPDPLYNPQKSLLRNAETLAEFPAVFSSTLIGTVFGLPSTASELIDEKGNVIGFTRFNTTAVQMYLSAFGQPECYQSSRLFFENLPDPDFFFRDRSKGLTYYREWGDTRAFCYDIVAPLLTPAERKQQMVNDLNRAFGVEAFMAEREVDCYLLQRTKPAGDTLEQIPGRVNTDPELHYISFYHARPAQIAAYLERNIYMNRPVFDDVGDSIPINGTMNYRGIAHVRETRDISLLINDLNAVGITLRPARRKTNVLVIRPKSDIFTRPGQQIPR